MERIVSFPGLGLEFSLNNAFIAIGPVKIYYYGIIITLGLVLGMVYAFKNFRKVGVDPDKAIDCILGGIVGGIVGARLYFVIFSWSDFGLDFSSWDAFGQTFLRLFNTREGGMAIYGGIIGALLIGVLIARWRKINVPALLDVVGVGFLIGQGIGRWGNFFNIEAFGSNTTLPWGMTSPVISDYLNSKLSYFESIGVSVDPSLPVHPCFLYESLWCILGAVLIAIYMKHRKFDGEAFLMYIAYYGVGRFVIEGLRTDSLMIGSLRVSQILAAILVLVAVLAIILIRSKKKGSHDETFMPLFVTTEAGQQILHNVKPDAEEKVVKDVTESDEIIEGEEAEETTEETESPIEETVEEDKTEE